MFVKRVNLQWNLYKHVVLILCGEEKNELRYFSYKSYSHLISLKNGY